MCFNQAAKNGPQETIHITLIASGQNACSCHQQKIAPRQTIKVIAILQLLSKQPVTSLKHLYWPIGLD